MKNIFVVIWTKAQMIKMAPIMKWLQDRNINYTYVLTGQHKETMDKLENNFGIKKPDVILYSWKDITWLIQMFFWIARILRKTVFRRKEIFGNSKRWVVLVHGDTFSTLLWALMWKLSGHKVAHIESGLRSFNLFHPFPEEITRLLTFRLSDYYFCPGDWALNNLKKYKWEKINTEYNTLYDALHLAIQNEDNVNIEIPDEKYSIFSIHRFENIFKKKQFEFILSQLTKISENIKVLFILHAPTRKKLLELWLMNLIEKNKNIELRPRYDYFEFNKLLHHAEFCVTDGWSNQEECFYMWKPCLLMRKATERQEGIGQNVIISDYKEDKIHEFISNYDSYKKNLIENKKSPTDVIIDFIIKQD